MATIKLCSLTVLMGLTVACSQQPETSRVQGTTGQPARTEPVQVKMMDAKGEQIGTAVITHRPQGIDIALDVKGLPPGEHGIHVHENPKCEGPDFESAGAHFNPENRAHGVQNPDGPHAGDMRNVFVHSAGTSQTTVSANKLTLDGSLNSVLRGSGTALVIHANPDDGRTDPSGNSGARIACGVIAP